MSETKEKSSAKHTGLSLLITRYETNQLPRLCGKVIELIQSLEADESSIDLDNGHSGSVVIIGSVELELWKAVTGEDLSDAVVYNCQNCSWAGAEEKMKNVGNIPDIFERVKPGEPMPAGECPECGALCHRSRV